MTRARAATRSAMVAALMMHSIAMHAQQLRGIVTDSSSGHPVSGAVVLMLSASRTTLARTIASERGEYAIAMGSNARMVRVLRIGFRAREVPIDERARDSGRLEIALATIPAMLEEVGVTASSKCPRSDDATQAFSLLDQARAGLLATVVARDARPAAMKLLMFDRIMDESNQRIARQRVAIDGKGNHAKAFSAVNRDFVRDGFARDSADVQQFFGPEAETLLDESFMLGYCVRIDRPERGRATQVGLGFYRPDPRRGRVDIEGTLWIDTVARALKDFDFRFIGAERVKGVRDPGGHIWFREMPNGVVLIDRWHLRLVGAKVDTEYLARGQRERVDYFNRESGGEIARAVWPDSSRWQGSLATVVLRVVDSLAQPATDVYVRFTDTDYVGRPGSDGFLEIRDVLPGPYNVEVIDATQTNGRISIGTSLRIVADRDSVIHRTLVAPPKIEFQREACFGARASWVTVKAVRKDKPVANVHWDVGESLETDNPFISLSGIADAQGTFSFCLHASRGTSTQVRIRAQTPGQKHTIKVLSTLGDVVRIELKP